MFAVPDLRERRHDHGHHAGHRHPAAVHVLRRLVDARVRSPRIGLVLNVHMRRFRVTRAPVRRRGHAGTLPADVDIRPIRLAAARTAAGQGRRSRLATSAARTGRSAPTTGRTGWPGCSSTPTPTRSACPTRACRSSTRSSTSAPTRVAERAYAPWVDLEARAAGRTGCRCSRVDTHRPAGRLRRAGVQPVGRARLHEPAQLHRPGRRAGAGRRPPARAPARRRRRPLHLQPRAARRLRRRRRARRRRGGRRRDHRGRRRLEGLRARRRRREDVLRELRHDPGRLRARRCTTSTYDGRAPGGGHAPLPRRARAWSRSAPSPTSPTGPTRSTSSCRSPRSSTTASTSRSSGAAPGAVGSARPA